MNRRLAVKVNLDTATHIVGAWCNGDILLGNVDTDTQALGIDIREMVFCFLRVFVGNIKTDMVETMNLHLVINGTGYNIARSQ